MLQKVVIKREDQLTLFDQWGNERIIQVLDKLNLLVDSVRSANRIAGRSGEQVSYDINLFMADILNCMDLLTFNYLSKVIGIKQAGRIWEQVKPQKD